MGILLIKGKDGKFVPVPGTQGSPGESAYEAALKGGFIGTYEDFCQAIAELTPNTQHTENKNNPHNVTAEQVGSLKVYKGFEFINADLNKTFNSDTPIEDIIKEMPDYTALIADIAANTTDTYPVQYGTVTVYKMQGQRAMIEFKQWGTHQMWVGDCTQEKGFNGFFPVIISPLNDGIAFENPDTEKPIVLKNTNSYSALEKHRTINTVPCRMDVGVDDDKNVVLGLAIGEENGVEAPEEYAQGLVLTQEGADIITKNDSGMSVRYSVYGTHNKPCSSYKGDGEGGGRSIFVGKTVNVLMVQSASEEMAWIVTPFGAIVVNSDDAKISYTSYLKLINGNSLRLSGTTANKKDKEYTYQVL